MLGFSGIGVVIENVLARMLQAHQEISFHVLVAAGARERFPWLSARNVFVSEWPCSIYSLKQHSEKLPPCHFPISGTWCPHYDVSAKLRGPLLVTIHDVLHLDTSILRRSLVQRIYANLMMRYARARASRLTFVSHFSRREFDRLVGLRSRPNEVIWNGVAPDWLQKDWIPSDDPHVVFVGNAMLHKNLSRLIEAIVLLSQKHSKPIPLTVIGNIESLKSLDAGALALAKALPNLIRMTGKIGNAELKDTVASALALISPSLYEGFSLPPLEALAVGLPIAVSDIPVHRELYSEKAIFFDPDSPVSIAEGIEKVIRVRDGRQERKCFAAKFSWEDTSARYFDALMKISGNDVN